MHSMMKQIVIKKGHRLGPGPRDNVTTLTLLKGLNYLPEVQWDNA